MAMAFSSTVLYTLSPPFTVTCVAAGVATAATSRSCPPPTAKQVLLGSVDGRVHAYNAVKHEGQLSLAPLEVLETLGASSVENMVGRGDALVVGDAQGGLCVFMHGQVVQRTRLGAAVTTLALDQSEGGSVGIVAGDWHGVLLGFWVMDTLEQWHIRFDDSVDNASGGVAAVVSARIGQTPSAGDRHASYLLVGQANRNTLSVCSKGCIVQTIKTATPVLCICAGLFLESHQGGKTELDDVAFGGADGFIYVLNRHRISKFAQVGFPIMGMATLRNSEGLDAIVCFGQFSGFKLYHKGSMVLEWGSDLEWLHCCAVAGPNELITVSYDNVVRVHDVQWIQNPKR